MYNNIKLKDGFIGTDGLEVRGGRLINNRQDSMAGITKAAIERKNVEMAKKSAQKIENYATGMALGIKMSKGF
jgi:hypothetical protein